MSEFLSALKKRRSIYALGRKVTLSRDEITTVVKDAVKNSPTAFNAQSPRAVILFGEAHEKLWDMTENALKEITPEEAFPATRSKIASFKAAYGTVLFFTETVTVKKLQEQFKLYAENFPHWAEQSNGIATANTWTALQTVGLGANLQHYNPLIDDEVKRAWNLPAEWRLRSQLVFGSIEGDVPEKEFLDDDTRFLVFDK
jgi:predicted oxidoreductase (fatty acid repression mutant protein)